MPPIHVKKVSKLVPEKFTEGVSPKTDVRITDVINKSHCAPINAGIIEIVKSEPCEFDYVHDCAVIYVTEGSFLLKDGDKKIELEAGDLIYVPQGNPNIQWSSPSRGRGFFVTYPNWR